jgi:hypothetical protein
MIDRVQKEMYTMGALIPHDAMLEECQATSEPHDFSRGSMSEMCPMQ